MLELSGWPSAYRISMPNRSLRMLLMDDYPAHKHFQILDTTIVNSKGSP